MLVRFSKVIEVAANIAIIVVAAFLATSLVKNYWRPTTASSMGVANTATAEPSPTNLATLDVDWSRNGQTLILAISSTCHFCSESASFYQALASNKGDTRLVAVLPQPVEEGRKYLGKLGVAVDDVKQVSLNEIGVSGTPSLVLVDNSGAIKNFWRGKLSAENERLVLDAVRKRG